MKLDPDAFYLPGDDAMRLIAAEKTLAKWRCAGTGPPFVKSGHRVLYRGADVLEWMQSQTIRPTGDPANPPPWKPKGSRRGRPARQRAAAGKG